MESEIKAQLSQIEKTHNVRILFAIESGSRAWGFPSPDSDYDARFVYVHPRAWYLQLEEGRDVIEHSCNAILDINGWDLKKALLLYQKTNPVIYEWLQSPIFYAQHTPFVKALLDAKDTFFNPRTGVYHYISLSERALSDLTGNAIKLKKYFYALRAALSARWIAEKEACPPMCLEPLLAILTEKSQIESIRKLVEQKSQLIEAEVLKIPEESLCAVHESLEIAKKSAETLAVRKGDRAWLNTLFQVTIG